VANAWWSDVARLVAEIERLRGETIPTTVHKRTKQYRIRSNVTLKSEGEPAMRPQDRPLYRRELTRTELAAIRRRVKGRGEVASGEARCPECLHEHTPIGCVGPPSPSDVWAGVYSSACDCDAEVSS
jgi:hypothetical protein